VKCMKCQGMMYADRFYSRNGAFQGWRCPMCGDIMDPVIFLHRISGDHDIPIPERPEDLIRLIQKYLKPQPAAAGRRNERNSARGI